MSKAPFGIIIEAKLKSGTTIAARDAAERLVASFKNDAASTKYWGYSTGTGTGEHVVLFAPFQRFADLDRPRVATIAARANTRIDVDGIITSLESNLASVSRSIVEYVPGLSNPPSQDASAPGPNIYHVKVELRPGSTVKAAQLAGKIAEAHRKAPNGVKYWGFSTAQGPGSTYHLFIPFDKYAELDGWASTGEVLSAANASEADSLLTEIDGLIEASERSILTYVPSLSNAA